MGKKHDKKPKLSKKELRKIAEREATKKAAKKAERKADAKRVAAEDAASKLKKGKKSKGKTQVAEQVAERAKPLSGKKLKAAMDADVAAGKERREQTAEQIDAEIKKRLEAKRDARAASSDKVPGKAELDALQEKVADDRAERAANAEALTEAKSKVKKAKKQKADYESTLDEAHIPVSAPLDEEPPTTTEPQFVEPKEVPADFEVNGNGQYKVKRPSDDKIVGYTRVTTYIACLEDTSRLTEWKLRLLLEGVAAAEENGNDAVTARIRDLVHTRDVAVAKARKQDRKGKLVHGQLKALVDAAFADFKNAMNTLADELFELGGGREAATKGTDLHALCDIAERDGIAAVNDLLEQGAITPSDFADVEAYVNALKRLGAKVTAAEQTIVNHDLKVAGRLDRVVLVKLPQIVDAKGEVIYAGDTRARRYVLDLKTGRVDYSQGKIAQQIRLYAESEAYDLETHETSSHGANRTHGLVLHIAAGSGEARLHIVDLTAGAHGNKLAGEVRSWRNTGKRAIDITTDILGQIEAA